MNHLQFELTMSNEKEYERFGPQWKAYVMKKSKSDLVDMYRKVCIELQQVKSVDLADVVCSSCGSSNKKWDRYEITLNDKDGTDVDVSVDYCEDCGHVFKMNEY